MIFILALYPSNRIPLVFNGDYLNKCHCLFIIMEKNRMKIEWNIKKKCPNSRVKIEYKQN